MNTLSTTQTAHDALKNALNDADTAAGKEIVGDALETLIESAKLKGIEKCVDCELFSERRHLDADCACEYCRPRKVERDFDIYQEGK